MTAAGVQEAPEVGIGDMPTKRTLTRPRRANGTGSIRKLKNGYRVRYRDEAGRQIVEPTLFKTKGDASRWLNHRQAQLDRGTWIDPRIGLVPLGPFAKSWIEDKPYTLRSREEAERNWRNHIEPTFGNVQISKITTEMVRRWYSERDKATGTGALRNAHNLLKAILATAVVDGLIASNPVRIEGANRPVGAERPLMEYRHVQAIADEISDHLKPLVLTTWWASARLGEVLALCWEDVDLEAAQVRIHRQVVRTSGGLVETHPKSHSHRVVKLPTVATEILRAHLVQAGAVGNMDRVFLNSVGEPLTHHAVNQAWGHARTRAQLPQFRFHDLRHGSATLAAQTGATLRDLMVRLGHKTVAAALVYQHAARDGGAAIASAMEAAVAPYADS